MRYTLGNAFPRNELQFQPYNFPMKSGFQCAGCGEWNEVTVDESAGLRQLYVEDCRVCCKPNVLHIDWDDDMGQVIIQAELE